MITDNAITAEVRKAVVIIWAIKTVLVIFDIMLTVALVMHFVLCFQKVQLLIN